MHTSDQAPKEVPKRKRGCLKGCATMLVTLILAPTLFVWFVSPGITGCHRPPGEQYKTRNLISILSRWSRYRTSCDREPYAYGFMVSFLIRLPCRMVACDKFITMSLKTIIKSWTQLDGFRAIHSNTKDTWESGQRELILTSTRKA